MASELSVSISATTTKFEQGIERVKSSLRGLKQTFGKGSLFGDVGSILAGGGAIAGLAVLARFATTIKSNISAVGEEFEKVGNKTDAIAIGFLRSLPLVGGMWEGATEEIKKANDQLDRHLKLSNAIRGLERSEMSAGKFGLDKQLFDFDTQTGTARGTILELRKSAAEQGNTTEVRRLQSLLASFDQRRSQERGSLIDTFVEPSDLAILKEAESELEKIEKQIDSMRGKDALAGTIDKLKGTEGGADVIKLLEKRRGVLQSLTLQQDHLNAEMKESNELAEYMGKLERESQSRADEIKAGNMTPIEAAAQSIHDAFDLLQSGKLSESEFGKFVQRTAKDSTVGGSVPNTAPGLVSGSLGAQQAIAQTSAPVVKAIEESNKRLAATVKNTGGTEREVKLLNKHLSNIGVAD